MSENSGEEPTDPAAWWDEAYEDDVPWDTGKPQSALVELEASGEIGGRVLDAGCGTGVEAAFLAERGHDVTGVDISATAIERARATARQRGVDVTFRVGDALDLDDGPDTYDTVVDSGLFHALPEDRRGTYADELGRVLRDDGTAFVLSFGEDAPTDWGPLPVSGSDVRDAFEDGWDVRTVRETTFETVEPVPGCLAVLDRS